jgi:mannose-6-phosphate isomerase-like protein (cupin superfamily)
MPRWVNPRTGASIESSVDGGDLVIERVMKPHTGKADGHRHMDYVESFEILEGTATIHVDGERRTLGPGERLEIPLGVGHVNPYNETDEDLRHLHRISAPGRPFAEAFVSALGHHMENGTVNDQGEFSDLQLFVVLRGTRAKSYKIGIPIWLQTPVLAIAAAIGRARGLKPRYD